MRDLADGEPDTAQGERLAGGYPSVRVAILGQPYWAGHLARMLASHASDLVEPTALPGSAARSLLFRRGGRPDVLVRAGYRPGAATVRGRAFDLLWTLIRAAHPQASTIYYWLGTDLFGAMREAAAGCLRPAFEAARRDRHLVTAPWHLGELADLGIEGTFAPMPYELPGGPISPMPKRFAVLTYIPQRRFAFFGGDDVFAVARQFPDVPFRVLGTRQRPPDAPGNVEFPGWLPSTDAIYQKSSVVLRLVQHDGIGGTVLEGLGHARQVIYTYPLPHVRQVSYGDAEDVARILSELLALHHAEGLPPNTEGRAYVRTQFDEVRLSRSLAALLAAAAPGG